VVRLDRTIYISTLPRPSSAMAGFAQGIYHRACFDRSPGQAR
jgi:hypothetical protein